MQHGLVAWTASRGWRLLAAAFAAAMVIARADAWAQPAPTPGASAQQLRQGVSRSCCEAEAGSC